MPLASDILALRDRTLDDQVAAYDYHSDTVRAWNLVGETIVAGGDLSSDNPVTGTKTSSVALAVKAERYVSEQLAEATFQQFLALFESFVFDLIRLWLTAYPRSLGRKTIDYRTILDLPDKAAITDLIVTRELIEIAYQRPAAWFAYLEEKANLGYPTPGEIERIAEAKATRDLLTHNRGFVNATYIAKAGPLARSALGERIEVAGPYHREVWDLLHHVVAAVGSAAAAKAS